MATLLLFALRIGHYIKQGVDASGRVVLSVCACVCVHVCSQGLNPALVARLPGWHFDMPYLCVPPSDALAVSDYCTRTRTATHAPHRPCTHRRIII